jgi:hypothetical protein
MTRPLKGAGKWNGREYAYKEDNNNHLIVNIQHLMRKIKEINILVNIYLFKSKFLSYQVLGRSLLGGPSSFL